MSFPVPAGMSIQSLEKDTVTLTINATHSVGKPHFIVIDRKVPNFSNGSYSQPRYRIRVIRGNVDADNLPLQARTLVDAEFQWMVGGDTEVISGDIVDPLMTLLNTEDFASLVFGKQALPGLSS